MKIGFCFSKRKGGACVKFHKDVWYNLAMITQLGISMLAPVFLCVFIGYELDEHFGWHTVLPLLILGILAGCRNCWMLLNERMPKSNGSVQPEGEGTGQLRKKEDKFGS